MCWLWPWSISKSLPIVKLCETSLCCFPSSGIWTWNATFQAMLKTMEQKIMEWFLSCTKMRIHHCNGVHHQVLAILSNKIWARVGQLTHFCFLWWGMVINPIFGIKGGMILQFRQSGSIWVSLKPDSSNSWLSWPEHLEETVAHDRDKNNHRLRWNQLHVP